MNKENSEVQRVTLATVAEHAGVSKATVSRVLNKAQCAVPISANTRKRVMQTARELNFFPSPLARALSSGKTKTIGVLGQDANFFAHSTHQQYTFTHQTLRYLLDSSVDLGYHVTLLVGEEPDPDAPFFDVGPVDGLLIVNRDMSKSDELIRMLRGYTQPVVYVFDYPDSPEVHYAAADNLQGGELLADAVAQKGHQQIGFVRDESFARIFDRREEGIRRALHRHGLEPPTSCVVSPEEVPAAVCEHNLTALICANDSIAHGIGHQGQTGDAVERFCFAHESRENPYDADQITAAVLPIDDIMRSAVEHLIALIEEKTTDVMQKQYSFTMSRARLWSAPRPQQAEALQENR